MNSNNVIIKKSPIFSGWSWFIASFNLAKKSFGTLLIITIIFMVVSIVASLIPFIGFLSLLLIPLLTSGFAIIGSKLSKNEEIEIGDLFFGFKNKTTELLKINFINFIPFVLIGIPGLVIGVFASLGMISPETLADVTSNTLLISLVVIYAVALMLCTPIYFFTIGNSIVLISVYNYSFKDACGLSYQAAKKNYMAYAVWIFISGILGLISIIPLGLGMIVLLPILMIAPFVLNEAIFEYKKSEETEIVV